jgi:hypothetical protein
LVFLYGKLKLSLKSPNFKIIIDLVKSKKLEREIRIKSSRFKKCIKYKGCKTLLRNILMLKKMTKFDDNYNYQLFNNNTKKGIGKTKAFKKTNNDINIYISPLEEKFENSENNITNPMKLLSEISTQTEQNETVTESTPSLFSRIFGSFKCGGS